MNLKLRDDNLYLTLHDFLTIYLPLKKRCKEMEEALGKIIPLSSTKSLTALSSGYPREFDRSAEQDQSLPPAQHYTKGSSKQPLNTQHHPPQWQGLPSRESLKSNSHI